MKKLFCILLACLMLTPAFVSCSENKAEADDGSSPASSGGTTQTDTPGVEPEETEEEKITAVSTLTPEDFGGRDYRMISTNQDNRQVDIIAEELTGATMNDLVYNRNAKVAELYNVSMKAEQADYGAINNMVKQDASSGDLSYDLYLTNYTANSLGSGGFLYDFYKMPSLQLDMAWWDQNEKADLTIMGKLFMAIGDISPTELLTSECMQFNKVLFTADAIA